MNIRLFLAATLITAGSPLGAAQLSGTSSPMADNAGPNGSVPVPKSQLAQLVRANDYPIQALMRREQGTVEYELTVTPKGKVSRCVIVKSSRSRDLDAVTCQIARTRQRFAPARDANGSPMEAKAFARMSWILPD
ncbi:MAG: energy transducer TonB [Pseudomonadota bacterium]|nr:energy transducer TonB [Pseudomonadota bacterium]